MKITMPQDDFARDTQLGRSAGEEGNPSVNPIATVATDSRKASVASGEFLSEHSATTSNSPPTTVVPIRHHPAALPIFVGVTGHHDIREDAVEGLKEYVDILFQSLTDAYPHTPIKLLSTLAPGADRLVARVAIERNSKLVCNASPDAIQKIGLIVPLPMSQEAYATVIAKDAVRQAIDATNPDPANEFIEMIGKAEASFVVPRRTQRKRRTSKGINPDLVTLADSAEEREDLYRQTSEFIARNCTILIALWDGKDDAPSRSQTALAVRYKLHGSMYQLKENKLDLDETDEEAFDYLEADAGGVVYHIQTQRSGARGLTTESAHDAKPVAPPADASPPRSWRSKQSPLHEMSLMDGAPAMELGDIPSKLRSGKSIEKFNKEAAQMQADPTWSVKIAKSEHNLFPTEQEHQLTQYQCDLRRCFAVADIMSIRHKHSATKYFWLFLLFASTAGMAFGLAHLPWFEEHLESVLLTYASAAGMLFVLRTVARKTGNQDWFQDCRALAEGLRVQFFWNIAGIHVPAGRCYFRKVRDDLDWIRSGIDAWDVLSACARGATSVEDAEVQTDDIKVVQRFWIRDQADWMLNKANEDHLLMRTNQGRVTAIVFTTLVLAILPGARVAIPNFPNVGAVYLGCLLFALHLFLVIAASLHLRAERLAHHQHAEQYQRTGLYLARANWLLTQLMERNDPESKVAAQRIFERVGREALAENGDWLLVHRERPLEAEGL